MRNPRRQWSTTLLLIPLFCGPLLAQEDADKQRLERVDLLSQEYDELYKKWLDSYRSASAKDRPEVRKRYPQPKKWATKFWGIVDAQPKDEAAFRAVTWLILHNAVGSEMPKVSGVLLHHAASERIGNLISNIGRSPTDVALKLLGKIEKHNPSVENRAQACFSRASCLKVRASVARSLRQSIAMKKLEQLTDFYGRETIDVLRNVDPDEAMALVEACYEKIMAHAEYGTVNHYRGNLAKAAKAELFEIRNLGIGKVAPEIVGEDLDGLAMKLSDYRGKVVVLDFWGDW